MPTIGDETAVRIQSAGLIQNLGPDALYVGESDVTVETGLQVPAGKALAVLAMNSWLYAISAGSSDVRTLGRATGIFSVEEPVETPE